jgi:cytochrome P450
VNRPTYPDTNLWSIRRKSCKPLEFLDALARDGDFMPFMLAWRHAVLLNRPDYVSTVLVSEARKFQKGRAIQRARHLLGSGLLTAEGALHAERRKALHPAFAGRRLEECASIVVSRASAMCDRWSPHRVIDVTHEIGELTFGIVGETIVGTDVSREFREVKEAVADATASLDPLVSLVAPLRHVRRAQARLRRVVRGAAARASSGAVANSALALLNARTGGEPLTEQDIDDLLTILLAGYDTITSALTWTWALLSAYPDVDARMREELKAVLGERDATADDVARLAYTRAIVAESLRLYPPAWVLARHAVESHRFDAGEVPAGTVVLISQYLLHRDARFFDRPTVFDPGRWLRDDQRIHRRLAYFPFGAGSRSCIGESFGWMEGVLLLATIARRWRLIAIDNTFPEIEARITLRPRGAVMMTVR